MLRFLPILAALAPIVLSVSQSFGEASARVVLSGTVAHKDGGYLLKFTAPVPNSVDAVTTLQSGPADAGLSARALRDALLKVDARHLQVGVQQTDPFALRLAEQKEGAAIVIGMDRPGLTCWVKRQADQQFFKLEPLKPVTLNNITFTYLRTLSNPSDASGKAATALQNDPPADDQTDTQSLLIWEDNLWANGSGLFLIPDPAKPGSGNLGVYLVCDLTYGQTVDKGANCPAFRWVAEDVKSCKELEAIHPLSASPCLGHICPPPCALTCICNTSRGRCEGKWGPL